jgi:hypothetical protein
MTDALGRLALQEAIRLSAEIEVQLTKDRASPLKAILARARRDAAEAIAGLVIADPEEPKAIRDLQNKVTLYLQMVDLTKEIVVEGIEADAIIGADQEQVIREDTELTPEQIAEFQKLGVSPQNQGVNDA